MKVTSDEERGYPALSQEAQGRTIREFQRQQRIDADYRAKQKTECGATDSSSEISKNAAHLPESHRWNPTLADPISAWRDPADERVYVVNGHFRVQLANENGVSNLKVKFLEAPDSNEARAVGALENIAQGRGSGMDAAMFFADSGYAPEWVSEFVASVRAMKAAVKDNSLGPSAEPSSGQSSLTEAQEKNLQAGLEGLRTAAKTVTAYNQPGEQMQDSKKIPSKMPTEPPKAGPSGAETFNEIADRITQQSVDYMNSLPKDFEVPY